MIPKIGSIWSYRLGQSGWAVFQVIGYYNRDNGIQIRHLSGYAYCLDQPLLLFCNGPFHKLEENDIVKARLNGLITGEDYERFAAL